MLWVGLSLIALAGLAAVYLIVTWRSLERTQQQEIEALQDEIEEVAKWADTDS